MGRLIAYRLATTLTNGVIAFLFALIFGGAGWVIASFIGYDPPYWDTCRIVFVVMFAWWEMCSVYRWVRDSYRLWRCAKRWQVPFGEVVEYFLARKLQRRDLGHGVPWHLWTKVEYERFKSLEGIAIGVANLLKRAMGA